MEQNDASIDRMYTDIEWALAEGLSPLEVTPLVERLLRQAKPGTLHSVYAKRQLAELIVRSAPFRAARLADEVLVVNPDDDRAHGTKGLAHLLMGHFKMAESCYRRALALVPHCPWYAHNLGHLLDVALKRPHEALPFLRLSCKALPLEHEIASSYAHALLSTGHEEEAWTLLLEAFDDDRSRAEELMHSWRQSG